MKKQPETRAGFSLAPLLFLVACAFFPSGHATAQSGFSLPDPVDAYYQAYAISGSIPDSTTPSDLLIPGKAGRGRTDSGIQGGREYTILLARKAYEDAEGIIAREAGKLLLVNLSAQGRLEECRMLVLSYGSRFGNDAFMLKTLLQTELRHGDEAGQLKALDSLEAADPKPSATEAEWRLWVRIFTLFRLNDPSWIPLALDALRSRPAGTWTVRIIDLVAGSDPDTPKITVEDRVLAAGRAALFRRDYKTAWSAVQDMLDDMLRPGLTETIISDLGKISLQSPEPLKLVAVWMDFEASLAAVGAASRKTLPAGAAKAGSGGNPGTVASSRSEWLAGFYAVRLLATAGHSEAITAAYLDLAKRGTTNQDIDTVLWYALDQDIKAIKTEAMILPWLDEAVKSSSPQSGAGLSPSMTGAYPEATPQAEQSETRLAVMKNRRKLELVLSTAALWKNPSFYEDIVEPFFREILASRDWSLASEMAVRLAPLCAEPLASRIRYVAGRLMDMEADRLDAKSEEAARIAEQDERDRIARELRMKVQEEMKEPGNSGNGNESGQAESNRISSRNDRDDGSFPDRSPGIGNEAPVTSVVIGENPESGRKESMPEPGKSADPAINTDAMRAGARSLFRTVRDSRGAGLYYQAMAVWQLGEDLAFLPSGVTDGLNASGTTAEIPAGSTNPPVYGSASGIWVQPDFPVSATAAFLNGFIVRDMAQAGGMEAMTRTASLSVTELDWLSFNLEAAGDYHYSLRLARIVTERRGTRAGVREYQRLYPRPWLAYIGSLVEGTPIPSLVFYGLLRSESLFDPWATSRSGARGLSQLMPPTAEETASRLKMTGYSIVDPVDNLYIGFRYYRSMVLANQNRLARGMFAYNAGPTRMRRWGLAFGDLPDDLVLEVLDIAEPRQYGRNITQASLYYGALYSGMSSREVLSVIFGEE